MTYAILITTAEGDNGSVERIPCETEQQAASLAWQKLEQYVSEGFRTEGMDNDTVYLTRGNTSLKIQRVATPHSEVVTNTDGRIAALESKLAAAIDALNHAIGLAEFGGGNPDDIHRWQLLLDAYDARQSTEVLPPVIPPERAEAVARINQRHTYYLAMLASRHEREREKTEDWYRRALNAALHEDENGI